MDIGAILNPVIMLFIAIFIGLISAKTGYIPMSAKDSISKLIVNITLPLFIITSLLSRDMTIETLRGALVASVSAVVVMTVLYFLGLLSARLFKMEEPTKTLHAVLTGSGNVAFMGYPIVLALFGSDALFYAIVYGMTNDAIFWSLGVYLINKSSGARNTKDALKKVINPATLAFIISVPLMLLGFKLPTVVGEALSGVGSLTTYLAMIFIGMVLSTINIKKIYKRATMLAPVLLKMVLAPIVAAVVLAGLGVSPMVCGAVVFEIAMSAQTVTSIIANEAGSDTEYAAEYIFFSTICALVTLPFVYWCFEKIVM